MGVLRNANNPQKMLEQMMQNNPQYKQVMDYVKANGNDPKAASEALSCFVKDVDKELKWAERSHINLVSADYSISYIMGLQDYWHDWYKKRMHK